MSDEVCTRAMHLASRLRHARQHRSTGIHRTAQRSTDTFSVGKLLALAYACSAR